jgi:hypothetical protein
LFQVPAAHGRHSFEREDTNVPAGHAKQVALEVAPSALLYVPSGQGVQTEAPPVEYDEDGQLMHFDDDAAPGRLRYLPAAHEMHVACDVAPTVVL